LLKQACGDQDLRPQCFVVAIGDAKDEELYRYFKNKMYSEGNVFALLLVTHARHTSRITHHTSHITHHISHITHHASHITHHTSHITHHTSHITHHTSPFTHHTSPFTPHSPPQWGRAREQLLQDERGGEGGGVNVNVNELRLGFSNTTRNPEGILSHNNRKS